MLTRILFVQIGKMSVDRVMTHGGVFEAPRFRHACGLKCVLAYSSAEGVFSNRSAPVFSTKVMGGLRGVMNITARTLTLLPRQRNKSLALRLID
jgi:hypothetical protein